MTALRRWLSALRPRRRPPRRPRAVVTVTVSVSPALAARGVVVHLVRSRGGGQPR